MRHALIIAGGSGTRMWPMSRRAEPKQLLPLVRGRSLLELAWDRLDGLVPPNRRWVCAHAALRQRILSLLPGLPPEQYLGEPQGRDTLPALAFSTSVIGGADAEAVLGVFTADQVIEPIATFQAVVGSGFDLVESRPKVLVTFGIAPTTPATGYGYLELGELLPTPSGSAAGARKLVRFKEKPDLDTAQRFVAQGPDRYLWNSGMFLWRASTFSSCLRSCQPEMAAAVERISSAWPTPDRTRILAEVYPQLKRTSVDYGVMEPASVDPARTVAAIPMPLQWLDVGSWPSYAQTCPGDGDGNAVGGGRALFVQSSGTLVTSSDPSHLVAALGCEDLFIVHTPNATLVCRKDRAEDVKKLQERVAREHGDDYA